MNSNIIIIGGGASALMLASLLPRGSATIIESNAKLGSKLLISGGGKCNITNVNMGTDYYSADRYFISHSLTQFDEKSLLKWLKKRGLSTELREEKFYFCRDSAKDIVNIFEKESKHQDFCLNETVLEVTKRDDIFYVKTDRRVHTSTTVVVASGGLSFPKIGASDIGYKIAQNFGHTIKQTAPALVGFTVQKDQFFFKELSGISTDVEIKIGDNTCSGALLFAHKGMSGPAVLDASVYWKKGQIEIDFLPNFNWIDFYGSKKQISSILPLPKRVTKAFLIQLRIEDKACIRLTKEEIEKVKTLSAYMVAPAGNFGYGKAEVTKGGVFTDEVDNVSMMSSIEDNLYFIGEVLDVTGLLGGYNFQWAFSSAYSCMIDIEGKRFE